MKTRLARVLALALIALPSGALAGTTWANRTVGQIQGSDSGTDCFFFTLVGVTQPDPVSPSPWIAIPRSQYGAKDAYAILLSAKLTGQQVRVTTNGAIACGGYATVSEVSML